MTSSAEPEPESRLQIRLQPLPIAVGTLVAFLVLRLLALVLESTGVGEQFFALPLGQFIALYSGGFAAGRIAKGSGFMNGVAVAVVFIIVWAILNAFYEARLVQEAGPAALPRMNMGGIIIGDLLNLIPAAFGGWFAERVGKPHGGAVGRAGATHTRE